MTTAANTPADADADAAGTFSDAAPITAPDPGAYADANVQRWLDALRSGDVRQGMHYLRQETTPAGNPAYCCLGLACELSDLGEWDVSDVTPAGYDASAYAVGDEWHYAPGSMPDAVAAAYGLRTGLGEFVATPGWLNDLAATSPETAAHIRRRIPMPNAADVIDGESHLVTLAFLNDTGFSFSEIADVIASAPPSLFE